MGEQKPLASWNPDEASGLVDNVRATIKAVVVDYFTADSGFKGVNVNVTFARTGEADITERYMLGSADQWAPNATKTGVHPLGEGNGKIWNRSDAHKFIKSLADAGFPKNRIGNDLSVFVGTDCHINRVTQDRTYTDKKTGKERTQTTMLVTKIYALPGEKGTGAKAVSKSNGAVAGEGPSSPTSSEHDDYATDVLLRVLKAKGPVSRDDLAKQAFIEITKDRKAPIRAAVQARLVDEAFLAGLMEAGKIGYDGTTVSAA